MKALNPDSGIVFNIQRCSIHDGPGIRTTVFLKGCPLRCFWCQNPESKWKEPQILWDKRKCTHCGACVRVCRNEAARYEEDRLIMDWDFCEKCGLCVDICPNEARSLAGKVMTADEVLHEVLKDLKFYENSGGGVTLSGGEPLFQPEFTAAILRKCKAAGLHTTLDTCGFAEWSTIEALLPDIDLFLFDIKHMDVIKHWLKTGRYNCDIVDNALLIAKCKPMRIRIPLIPGFNDSVEEVRAIAEYVKKGLGLGPDDIDLLPYNPLGEIKYEFLDLIPTPGRTQTEEHLKALEAAIGRPPKEMNPSVTPPKKRKGTKKGTDLPNP